MSRRTVTVKLGKLVLISNYMPVLRNDNWGEVEEERDVLREHLEEVTREETVVVGGDFNAHIGEGEERTGIVGKFGLRRSNEQGRSLAQWCEEMGMAYVNSFYNHKRRGTWFSNVYKRWYELDGFLMRREQRHKRVIKVNTVNENTLSDHKPKRMIIQKRGEGGWKTREKKTPPRIKWEKLNVTSVEENYRAKGNELMEEEWREDEEEKNAGWNKITRVCVEAAKETCGIAEKRIENPWMVENEEEVENLRTRIKIALEQRNEVAEGGGTSR